MTTSTVTLYYTSSTAEWELIPSRLLKVDSIADYLALKTKKTINNFQYIKPELETAITVDLSQIYASPLMPSYKYVSIKNSDDTTGKIYYYFIKNAVWRSKTAVRFELVMDVLNTFTEGSDFTFKATTKISREHKDRYVAGNISVNISMTVLGSLGSISQYDEVQLFYVVSGVRVNVCTGEIDSIDGSSFTLKITDDITVTELKAGLNHNASYFIEKDNANSIEFEIMDYEVLFDTFRKIDPIAEGINPVLQCGDTEGNLIEDEKSLLQQDWYLLYRNVENPMDSTKITNPVECYLIPENATPVSTGSITDGKVTSASLENGKFYYMPLANGESITLSNGVTITGEPSPLYHLILIQKSINNRISVTHYKYQFYPSELLYGRTYNDLEYMNLDQLPMDYMETNEYKAPSWVIANYSQTGEWDEDAVSQEVDPITLLDRTDVKNIKLIKLPYCPYDFNIFAGKLNIASSDWNYTTITQDNGSFYCLKLIDLNTKLTNTFSKIGLNNSPYSQFAITLGTINNNQPRKDYTYESKLLHSEFYRPTYVYDSFTFVMQMEKLDNEYYFDSLYRKLKLKFTMTSTINSKFMFTFAHYKLKLGDENYGKYMTISRNNEEVLYNIPYINYIRSGFNYDKKQKALQNTSNFIGIGGSALTIGASLLFAPAPLKIAGVIGGIVSFAMNTKNAVVSSIKSEEDLKQKLLQKKQESASVEGSDDVDLMSEYAENRIKYLEYTPNETMRNLINDLFFYAGYSSGRMGVPNHNTRLNFDYLECDAVIEKVGNLPDDILSEIVNCYKNGVTYLHKTTRTGVSAWDFAQTRENWEKWLLN